MIPRTEASIVAVGDSITAGYGALHPWPSILADTLGTSSVIGFGLTGWRADLQVAWDTYMRQRIRDTQPDIVFVALGTNDWIEQRDPVAYAADMHTVVDRIEDDAPTTDVVLIHMPRPLWPEKPITYATYGAQLAEVADSTGAAILDWGAAWDAMPELRQPDGVHPSPAGQDHIGTWLAWWLEWTGRITT